MASVYEKPATRGQWQEKSDAPIASRPMTKKDLEELRELHVRSYKCADADITYEFQKITDEHDRDRDDCMWVKYKLRCVVNNQPMNREIFGIKIPVPEELRRIAERLRQDSQKQTSPTDGAAPQYNPYQVPPKTRRPIKK